MEDKQSMMLEFEADVITLDLPDSPPRVVDGWKILPLTRPKACVQINMVILYLHIVRISCSFHRLRGLIVCSLSLVRVLLHVQLN